MEMLASADTYFGVESGAFDSYLPDEKTLASITIPIEGSRSGAEPRVLL